MRKKSVLFISIILLLLSSCSGMFQSKLGVKNSNASLIDLSINPDAPIILTKPAQVFVSKGNSTTTITLSWSTVKGASFYNVYRAAADISSEAAPAEDDYTLVQEVYATELSDTIQDNGVTLDYSSEVYSKKYYYKVEAENPSLGVDPGPKSDAVSGFLLAPPRTLRADTGLSTTSIIVRWDKVPGAAQYKVFRTENPNGVDGLASRGTVVTDMYRNEISATEQGKEFYYVVTAISANGAESYKSPIAMGFSLKDGAPDIITGVKADKSKSGSEITVIWEAVKMNQDKTTYTVYRNSSKSSQFVVVAKNLAGNSTTFTDKTSDAKSSIEPNITYYYYLQAVKEAEEPDKDGNKIYLKSGFSQQTTDSEGYLLSPPPGASCYALAKPNGTEIYWSAPIGSATEQSAYTYSIRYSDINSKVLSDFRPLSLSVESVGAGKFRAVDTNKSGFYTIVTLYNGVESEMFVVMEPAPGPVTNLRYDKMTTSANTSGVYPVKLTWSKPDDVAVAYDIYRSSVTNTSFKKVNTSPVRDLSWIDDISVAVPAKFYYYKVQAINSINQGLFAENSAVAETFGHLTAQAFYKEYEKSIVSSQKKLTYMNKPGTTDKLGSETKSGKMGTVSYSAAVAGLGARIIIEYKDYSDFVNSKGATIMQLTGNSNTTANMSSNGNMDGTITVTGMYSGTVNYNNVVITAGAAGGGYYLVKPEGFAESKINHKGVLIP